MGILEFIDALAGYNYVLSHTQVPTWAAGVLLYSRKKELL